MEPKPAIGDDVPLTRAYLESLTTPDILKMADDLGMDIPPELDRIFIIEEMLDLSSAEEEAPDTAAEGAEAIDGLGQPKSPADFSQAGIRHETDGPDSGFIESAPLPKQYNITYIDVMIRDPLWAFVFWELKTQDRELLEKSPDFEGYFLKVSALAPGSSEQSADNEGIFTVPVAPGDSAWYLGIAPAREGPASQKRVSIRDYTAGDAWSGASPQSEIQYKVDLCANMKGDETVLVSSNPFSLPGLYDSSSGNGQQRPSPNINPLVRLSGYGDFNILRYSERPFRAKKDVSIGSYE